jgi:CheY-like chemotaxis protein
MGGENIVNGVLVSLDDVTELERKEIQLREATEKAMSANQAKSEFLANMSHEIRTPMNAVLGFTELMRRGNAQTVEQSAKYLETIHRNGKHLLDLINDILDLSKVESGEFTIEDIACQPYRIAAEVIEILSVRAQEKGVGLTLHIDSDVPESVAGDPARMRQVITNLTGNAIKFTEKGSVEIRLRWVGDRRQGQMEISIKDSGIGIPADKLATIFDPFTQAESSTTRRFGGTGLGLTISRRFAQAMKGDILLESVYGEGSTFTLAFPVKHADENGSAIKLIPPQAAMAAAETSETDHTMTWHFTRGRVLVADDAPENRQLVNVLLSEVGIEIVEAEDGQQAVDLATSQTFDLILMDMQMPLMDGLEAVRRIRDREREEGGARVSICMLTANALPQFKTMAHEAGADDFLTKPISASDLIGRVIAMSA